MSLLVGVVNAKSHGGGAACSEPLGIMRRVVRPGAPGAKVAELVDAQDLGSCGATRESSSLSFRTKPRCNGIRSRCATPSGNQAVTDESERLNGAR